MNLHNAAVPLLLALLCAPLSAQDKTTFRINAKKGDQARFRATTDSDRGMGGSMTLTKEIAVKVLDTNDKELLVEFKIESVKGKVAAGPMGDIEIDSTKKEDDEEGMPGMVRKSMTMLAGKTVRATVSPDGTKVKAQDAKELIAEIQKGMGMMGRMGGGVDEATLAHEIEGVFGRFPSTETAAGGTWQTSETQRQGGIGMTMDIKHKLEKVEADRILVTFEGTISKAKEDKAESRPAKEGEEEDAQAAQMREMMRSVEIENGKITGRSEISRKDGMVLKSEVNSSMEMAVMGMQVAVKNTSSIERVTGEAKPADAATQPGQPKKDETKKDEPKKEEPKKK